MKCNAKKISPPEHRSYGKDIFAIRTMFWWGNFFSITLHLSGIYKTMFAQKIIACYELLKETDFFICVHEEQWQHHFEKDNYIT